MRRYLPIVLLAMFVSCSNSTITTPDTTKPAAEFDKLTEDLLYGSLALSPVSATQVGYHEHSGVQLDEQLDDYSAAAIDSQGRFYEGFQTRASPRSTRLPSTKNSRRISKSTHIVLK